MSPLSQKQHRNIAGTNPSPSGPSTRQSTRPASVTLRWRHALSSRGLHLTREHFPPAHPPTSTPGGGSGRHQMLAQTRATAGCAPGSPPHLLTWGRGEPRDLLLRAQADPPLYVRRGAPAVPWSDFLSGYSPGWRRAWRAQVLSSTANHHGQVISPPWLLLLLCSPPAGGTWRGQ